MRRPPAIATSPKPRSSAVEGSGMVAIHASVKPEGLVPNPVKEDFSLPAGIPSAPRPRTTR